MKADAITVMQRDVADMSLSSLDERLVNLIQGMLQVKSASPFVLGVISTAEMPLYHWRVGPQQRGYGPLTGGRALACSGPTRFYWA
ncbi:MAG: hypothetical protein R2911_40100 [Caldilineaceae bacterium]